MIISKNEIIDNIAEEYKVTKTEAKERLESVLSTMFNTFQNLADKDKVQIKGFGTFEMRFTPERMGRKPSTGESVKIKAGKKIAFKMSQTMKDTLNPKD